MLSIGYWLSIYGRPGRAMAGCRRKPPRILTGWTATRSSSSIRLMVRAGFLAGGTEWTVSLAVVANGRPVAAALYAPALGIMFTAAAGAGAARNGAPLRVSNRTEIAGANLAGSRRLVRDILEATTIRLEYRGYIPSLAYRFALVASGEVDVAVARPGAYDWDLAASDLLVHEAGGQLAGLDGEPPRYVGSDRRHPLLLAATPALGGEMTALVAEIERIRTD